MRKDQLVDPQAEQELARADDAVIGRAFSWSAIALIVLITIAGGIYFAAKWKPAPQPARLTPLSAPTVPQKPVALVPVVTFTEIARQAGITFTHNNGARGEKLLPETMGGGVGFLDCDNDGDQDLLFINSADWPWDQGGRPGQPGVVLYKNDGDGSFSDVTVSAGLGISFYGMGAACGDYDNDGWVDLFVSAVGGNHLFHNERGVRFREVTAEAGVGGLQDGWSTSASWLDFDRDGLLDLFVCNYVKWSREIDAEVGYKIDGKNRAYGPPTNFQGAYAYLYRNEGAGRFRDVSLEAGVRIANPLLDVPAAKSLGVAPVDVDQDGWIDLVVANDTVPNFLFINQRNGTFAEAGGSSGIAFDSYGNTRGAMGIDAARYRPDGRLGIAIGNFANEMTALYVAQDTLTNFTDEAITEGVGPASRLLLKFGIFFFDYDLDGYLDLLSANGHLEEEISKIQRSQTYAQPAQLFWNASGRDGGGFVAVNADQAGSDLFRPIVGRGSAFADIDGDGDLDVVLTQTGGAPLLLRNDQHLEHRWLRLKLVGTKSNRDAIGAWIMMKLDGQEIWRQVMPTRSYLSQSELPVTIGLGDRRLPQQLEIFWPSGRRQVVSSLVENQLVTITEPDTLPTR